MREAIGGTWLFNLVIFFILLFAGYMCLSINYSKAFNVKDKIVNEVERNGGIKNFGNKNDNALHNISEYMKKVGYRTKGKCDKDLFEDGYGCDRDGKCVDFNPNTLYAYCIKEITYDKAYTGSVPGEFVYLSYYQMQVFYHLDLPVIRSVFNFNIKGDTKMLYRIGNNKPKSNP